jgi:sec-independent protein translocase protein TatB
MFDLGWGELVVIGIVALIAIGPKELPTVLRTLGQYMAKIRRMASEFQGQFQEAMREAELHDIKKQAEDLGSSVTDITSFDPMADVQKDLETAIESEPAKAELPAPEPAAAEPADKPAQTEAAPEPLPAIEAALPDQPAPVSEKDFAAAEPPAKQAGGKA